MTEKTTAPPQAVFLINHYMRGIHAGIQAGHAISRFHMKYPENCAAFSLIQQWNGEPWFQLLNGGFDSHLEEAAQAIEAINRDLENTPHPLIPGGQVPFVRFHEGQRELRGALTAVVMLLPGGFFLRDEDDNLPEDFAALLKKSKRSRAATAIERNDLSAEYRIGLLHHNLGFAQ